MPAWLGSVHNALGQTEGGAAQAAAHAGHPDPAAHGAADPASIPVLGLLHALGEVAQVFQQPGAAASTQRVTVPAAAAPGAGTTGPATGARRVDASRTYHVSVHGVQDPERAAERAVELIDARDRAEADRDHAVDGGG